jgi:hypothetical protein
MHRIESLFLAFCGLVLFTLVMRPATEKFLMSIFSWRFREFLTSLLLALFLSLMLFGILGIFSSRGVHLIPHYPILFSVVWGVGIVILSLGNRPGGGLDA